MNIEFKKIFIKGGCEGKKMMPFAIQVFMFTTFLFFLPLITGIVALWVIMGKKYEVKNNMFDISCDKEK